MLKFIPMSTYTGVVIFFFLAFAFDLLKLKKIEKIAVLIGFCLCGTGIILMMILEKRPLLYGPFEAAIYISFILGFLIVLPGNALLPGLSKNNVPCITYLVIVVLLLLQIGKGIELNNDFYMYDDLKVIVFFNFRLIAAALFIYAAIIVNSRILTKTKIESCEKELLMKNGRNFLLAAMAVYLISELSGSIWCLDWLGDTWMWSKGFFKSSIIFLLVMLAIHLPPSFFKSYALRAVLSSFPAIFILWMIFYH